MFRAKQTGIYLLRDILGRGQRCFTTIDAEKLSCKFLSTKNNLFGMKRESLKYKIFIGSHYKAEVI